MTAEHAHSPSIETVLSRHRGHAWHTLRVLSWLISMHLFTASQLWPIAGSFIAMLYLCFPPILSFAVYGAAQAAPLFTLLCCACVLGIAALLWPLVSQACRAVPWLLRTLLVLAFAIWLPALSGESVRWLLMRSALSDARPDCFFTSTLADSLRQRFEFDDMRDPHAWMIRDGHYWHWSYRRLRFERDENTGAFRRCPELISN